MTAYYCKVGLKLLPLLFACDIELQLAYSFWLRYKTFLLYRDSPLRRK